MLEIRGCTLQPTHTQPSLNNIASSSKILEIPIQPIYPLNLNIGNVKEWIYMAPPRDPKQRIYQTLLQHRHKGRHQEQMRIRQTHGYSNPAAVCRCLLEMLSLSTSSLHIMQPEALYPFHNGPPPEEKRPSEDLCLDRKILLKWI